MVRSPDLPPPLPWYVSFSSASLDGRSDWLPGSLFLNHPSTFFFLRNGDEKIEEGRHLRDGERITPGNDDDPQPDAERVAVQAADVVLSGEACDDGGGSWSTAQPRRKKTKEELVQEF